MKKNIKILIFVLIIILMFGVILSDPVKAKISKEVFENRIEKTEKFKIAEDIYDFKDYIIRWNNLDWMKLVQDSKNILEIRVNPEALVRKNERVVEILNVSECSEKENRIKMFIEKKDLNKQFDYNFLKGTYYIESDDEDSHINSISYI